MPIDKPGNKRQEAGTEAPRRALSQSGPQHSAQVQHGGTRWTAVGSQAGGDPETQGIPAVVAPGAAAWGRDL